MPCQPLLRPLVRRASRPKVGIARHVVVRRPFSKDFVSPNLQKLHHDWSARAQMQLLQKYGLVRV
jgi:hypothetical protein